MRLRDTIDYGNIPDDGIFSKIKNVSTSDVLIPLPWLTTPKSQIMNYEYYLSRSGDKTVSSFFEYQVNILNDLTLTARIIVSKFGDKWNRLYHTLNLDYEFDRDYFEHKVETPNTTDTETPNITNTEERDLSQTSQTSEKSKIKETVSGSDADITFGFNSTFGVDSSKTTKDQTTTTEGSDTENVTDIADTDTGSITSTETGTRTKTRAGTITTERYGRRDHTPQHMVKAEIELRQTLFDNLVMSDVDSIICLKIYE